MTDPNFELKQSIIRTIISNEDDICDNVQAIENLNNNQNLQPVNSSTIVVINSTNSPIEPTTSSTISSIEEHTNDSREIVERKSESMILNIKKWFNYNTDIIENIENQIFDSLTSKFERRYVYIRNKTLRIWTASANTESSRTPVVLIHGLCGAIGLWTHNIDKLCESNPLYAIDLLGFGRSSRPKFSNDPVIAEQEFVRSIEEWREQVELDKMVLIGHSFGGFLVTSYALQYPEHVKALILVDPWGFTADDDLSFEKPLWLRVFSKFSQYLSPFSIIRVTGPIGVKLFKRLRPDFKNRFYKMFGNSDVIYDYIYHSNRLSPSGERAFCAIADSIRNLFHAKYPMTNRIENLKPNIPIWFIHGYDSVVDRNAGPFVKSLRDSYGYVSVKIIHDAGHHVHADQPELFNTHVKEILDEIEKLNN